MGEGNVVKCQLFNGTFSRSHLVSFIQRASDVPVNLIRICGDRRGKCQCLK